MMRKLDKYGYSGPLVLEVYRNVREDYKKLSPEEFMATSFGRIKRISELNQL
jgi:sugar phosphate isomerase/epimerase